MFDIDLYLPAFMIAVTCLGMVTLAFYWAFYGWPKNDE